MLYNKNSIRSHYLLDIIIFLLLIFEPLRKNIIKIIKITENEESNLKIYLENKYKINNSGLFDWDNIFFKYVQQCDKGKELYTQIIEIISNNKWDTYFGANNVTNINSLINKYFIYVNQLYINNKIISYIYIPCYIQFLLKYEQVLKISNIFANDILLNTIYYVNINISLIFCVPILIKKSNLYLPDNIIYVFNIIERLLLTIDKTKGAIPSHFCYDLLLKAISIIFDSDYYIYINKVIQFIYNCFHIFNSIIKS